MVNCNDPSPSLRKKAANKMNVLLSKKLNSLKKSKMANFKHKLKSLSPTKKMGIFSKNCRFEGVSSTIVKTLKRPSPKKKAISRRITIRQNVNSSKDVITKKFSVIHDPEPGHPSILNRRFCSPNQRTPYQNLNQTTIPNIFTFDTFGDRKLPKKKISRRCKMDLSQIVSDCELEAIKTNILSNYDANEKSNVL
ncbi:unnamed protein product [Moneuplotes crassus]|uniref:Uncharacterized protein n=1 Tax=Euplotes crassus TaxID=5936 RepID=A0AAD1XSV4_EUPCR|nr:unnamed protein product [Moneuplotes crassus]